MRPTGKRRSLPATGSEAPGPISITYLALRRSSLMVFPCRPVINEDEESSACKLRLPGAKRHHHHIPIRGLRGIDRPDRRHAMLHAVVVDQRRVERLAQREAAE